MNKLYGLCFILLATPCFAEPELKGSPQELKRFLHPNDNIVSISGFAEEKAYSDKAIVSLVVTTEDKLLSNAIAKNSALRNTITSELMNRGLSENDIKSSKFSSSPQYGWFKNKPASYKVINRMAITITTESALEDIALVADRATEIELSDTQFEHSEKQRFNEMVKSKALDHILKQKSIYEKTLGVTLTPIGIHNSEIFQGATQGAIALESIVVSGARQENEAYLSSSRVQKTRPGNSFDEVVYQARLSVDFKINQAGSAKDSP